MKLKLRLEFPLEAGVSPDIIVQAPQPLQLRARVLYTVGQTGTLADRLGLFKPLVITQRLDMGTCSGDSVGPSSYPVGRHDVNGDLSFRIRSGPIGTNCQYTDIRGAQNPVILPSGILLHDSSWSTSGGSPRCRALQQEKLGSGPAALTPSRIPWTEAPNDLDAVYGLDRALVDAGSNVVIHEGLPGFRSSLRSVMVHLKCDPTAVNDHEIRATLESVTFSGPEGWGGM